MNGNNLPEGIGSTPYDDEVAKLNAQVESLQQQLDEANSENDLLRTRLGSILWSGSLDDKTCGTVQKWAEEYKSALEQERDKLMALVVEKDKALDKLMQACPGSQWTGSPPSDIASRAKLLTPSNLPRFVPEEKVNQLLEDVSNFISSVRKRAFSEVKAPSAGASNIMADCVCAENYIEKFKADLFYAQAEKEGV